MTLSLSTGHEIMLLFILVITVVPEHIPFVTTTRYGQITALLALMVLSFILAAGDSDE